MSGQPARTNSIPAQFDTSNGALTPQCNGGGLIDIYRTMATTTVYRKLRLLATALIVVEFFAFEYWFYGKDCSIVECFGTLFPPASEEQQDSSPLPPSLKTKRFSQHPLVTNNQASILSSDPLLKVYVYDNLPASLTVDALEQCVFNRTYSNIEKKKDNFMADVFIIRLFESYPGRTYDANEADLFVVPYPHKTHCICNLPTIPAPQGVIHCPQVTNQDIDLLLSSLTYFNETTTARHLFIASGDFGWSNLRLESMPLSLTLGPRPEYKIGVIVIPYLNERPEYQPSVLRNQQWNFEKKNLSFSYFWGDAIPRKMRPIFSKLVKKTYGTHLGGLPFVVERLYKWTAERQDFVFQSYRQSIFCPCLPGDNARKWKRKCCLGTGTVLTTCTRRLTVASPATTAQKRFFDVILSGCLPVVLSFNESRLPGRKSWYHTQRASVESSYPFAKGIFDDSVEIDYESFVVQVQENVSNIKPTLEAILANPKELQRRQANLAKYAPLLSYGIGNDAHKYDDAFLRIIKTIRYNLNGLETTNSSRNGNGTTTILMANDTQPSLGDIEAVLRDDEDVETNRLSAEMGLSRNSLPNGPKTHRPQLSNELLGRFIVVPERKLLFCYVEKVGCSMFNHLFRMLRLSLPEVSQKAKAFQANFTWYRNTPGHYGLNKTRLEDLLVDPSWTKAVFYRDPVTRFLSAYRSKCEAGHDTTPDCEAVFGKRYASFDEALTRMEKRGMPRNPHFAPASTFCGGLGSTIDYYDVVHELNAETAPAHVTALLQQIGVESETTKLLVDNIVRTGGTNRDGDIKLAAQWGVELGLGRTQGMSHNTEASKDLCEYYNSSEKVALIMKLYSIDYDTFQLTPREVNCTTRTNEAAFVDF